MRRIRPGKRFKHLWINIFITRRVVRARRAEKFIPSSQDMVVVNFLQSNRKKPSPL